MTKQVRIFQFAIQKSIQNKKSMTNVLNQEISREIITKSPSKSTKPENFELNSNKKTYSKVSDINLCAQGYSVCNAVKIIPSKISLEITNAIHYKTQEDSICNLVEEPEQEDLNSLIEIKNKPVLSSQRYFDIKYKKHIRQKEKIRNNERINNNHNMSEISKIQCATENNVSHYSCENEMKKDSIDLSIIKPIEIIQMDPQLMELLQLPLTGKTSKTYGSFKVYKNENSLKNLCSMIPNQPAPKKNKKFENIFGGAGQS